jgi:hypothetical protein
MNQTARCQAVEALCPATVVESAWTRVAEILALITAIDAGELLAELPEDAGARVRHTAGICLLAVMQRELTSLQFDLDGALPGI